MYTKKTLNNGLTVLTAPNKHSKTTTFLVLVGVGSRYEDHEQNGISHFLEHMMFKGTKKRPTAKIIARQLDSLGASYNAFTGQEYTGYWVKVRNENKNIAMDVIADIFQNSVLKQSDIDVEKGAVIEELNMYLDLPMRHVGDLFQSLLYGDTPLGREIIGTKDLLLNFKRDQFVDYFNQKYLAQNTIIAIAGGGVSSGTTAEIERLFSSIRQGQKPERQAAQTAQAEPQVLIQYKKTDQTHLIYGFRTFDAHHPQRYVASLTSTILGGYMSSRLFTEIREKRGLAYYVRAGADHFDDAGELSVSAGVKNDKVLEAIRIITKEFKDIKTKGVSSAELKTAKENIKGQIAMGFESSDEIATTIAMYELQHGKPLDLDEELRQYDLVSAQDITDFMNTYCKPENLNIALIGNFKQDKDSQKFLDLMNL